MAYFEHAFRKVFLATGNWNNTGLPFVLPTSNVNHLKDLVGLPSGLIAFINPETWEIIDPTATTPAGVCKPFIIANTSLITVDKIGDHGGYMQPDLTKIINPRYLVGFWQSRACEPLPYVVAIGADACDNCEKCSPAVKCDTTYVLNVEVKGPAADSLFTHDIKRQIAYHTPCCATGSLTDVIDPTYLYIGLAKEILKDPILSKVIFPIVYSNGSGTNQYYADGTLPSTITLIPNVVGTLDSYSPSSTPIDPICAGLVLVGAFVGERFSNCSFEPNDHYEIAPVRIFASFVDTKGDPCDYFKPCTTVISEGFQGQGYGDSLQRDLLYYNSYLQNNYITDPRIREVIHANDMLINRTVKYDTFSLVHRIPRPVSNLAPSNNVYNSDKYVITFILNRATPVTNPLNTLKTYLSTLVCTCPACDGLVDENGIKVNDDYYSAQSTVTIDICQ